MGGRNRFGIFLATLPDVQIKIAKNLEIYRAPETKIKSRILGDLFPKEEVTHLSDNLRSLLTLNESLTNEISTALNDNNLPVDSLRDPEYFQVTATAIHADLLKSPIKLWLDMCIAEAMQILFSGKSMVIEENVAFVLSDVTGISKLDVDDTDDNDLKKSLLNFMMSDEIIGRLKGEKSSDPTVDNPLQRLLSKFLTTLSDAFISQTKISRQSLADLLISIQQQANTLEKSNPIVIEANYFLASHAIEKKSGKDDLAKKILTEIDKEKNSTSKHKISTPELTRTLILVNTALEDGNNAQALLDQAHALNHRKKRNIIAMGLIILAASIVTAGLIAASVASFGVATPLTAIGLAITATVTSHALLIAGAGVALGAGALSAGLFAKFKLTKSPIRKAVEELGHKIKPSKK